MHWSSSHCLLLPSRNWCLQGLWHYAVPASLSLFFTSAPAKSLQLCSTLCNPIDGSPPGSPVPGILQARTLEWVAISFSNAWKWKVKVKSFGRVRLFATPWTAAYQAPPFLGFSRQEYWSGVPLPSPLIHLITPRISAGINSSSSTPFCVPVSRSPGFEVRSTRVWIQASLFKNTWYWASNLILPSFRFLLFKIDIILSASQCSRQD